MTRIRSAMLASALLLPLLQACSDQEPVIQQPEAQPPATQEAPAGDNASEAADEAVDKLRDAARTAAEGASELAQEARKAAEEALKDAGPALERAGELAGQFKETVDEIIARAAEDLERATTALEKQIAESTQDETSSPPGDPAAVLAPPDRLRADTRAAARARPAGVGPDYVGVWAADAASCARIDQDAVENFAVITPTTIRRAESVCNFATAEMADGKAALAASCIAEGAEENRQIALTLPSPDRLQISFAGESGAADLVRCHLPQ
jgi:hypothetical protein